MDRGFDGFRNAAARLLSRIGLGPSTPQVGAIPVIGNLCISMVRNEQDIIEPFIRHNARFFDAMIVLDNGSQDRTREILLGLSRELGHILIADLPFGQYDQSQFMSNALRFAQGAFFADTVAFLDADEFIACPSREAFDASISTIPVGETGLMTWRTFLPNPALGGGDVQDPLVRMTHRRRQEDPSYKKVVLRLGGGLKSDLTVLQGNHAVRAATGRKLEARVLSDVTLMHFPVRSSPQLVVKGVLGWKAQLARDPGLAAKRDAYQWRRISDLVAHGKTDFSPGELAQEALAYAQVEADRDFESDAVAEPHGILTWRRYSDVSFGDVATLLERSEAPERMHSQRFALPRPQSKGNLDPGIENAFDGAWHWDFLFMDMPPIQALMEKYRPSSVLDVGCGNGAYPLLYKFFGAQDVLGLDGIEPEATVLSAQEYRKVDLQQRFDAGRKFDLVVCLEVIEHVDPSSTATVLDTIERHAAGMILFSMAEPGQPGNGHINCRSISEVLDLWAARGWQPQLHDTLAVRALSTMSWFRRNIVVLRQTGETGETPAAVQLRRIGAKDYRWYKQTPGLRLAPFCEAYPAKQRAYGG